MTEILLTPEKLSERWGISTGTLGQWRWYGKGPYYLKLEGHILYPLEDIEQFEQINRRRTTSDNPHLIAQLGTSQKYCPDLSKGRR